MEAVSDTLESAAVKKLCNENMKGFTVPSPLYDRSKITPGIVHFGVGCFHRAHQARYIDRLLEQDPNTPFGIVGVGVMDCDRAMHDALLEQDCLYTLIEQQSAKNEARIVGSLIDVLFAPDKREETLELLSAESTKLVTLTITEGGYCINQATSELRFDLEGIQNDINNPSIPQTVFGFIIEALRRRRDRNVQPFTVLSCDNLQGNGCVTRSVVLSLANQSDKELSRWIEENVAFPNSMVDRITPATTDAHRQLVRETFGIDDNRPVVCEPFVQWIVEDKFCNDRPAWESVGVQMVQDVIPYEKMKIRLLNASHSLMGYLGYLAGYRYIFEITQDADFQQYVRNFMNNEATPIIGEIPGIDLSQYKETLIERFANPAIRDEARRICLDGSGKIPKFIIPTIKEQLARGGDIRGATLCVASWFRYLTGTDESGEAYPIEDPMAEELQKRALQGGEDPTPLLGMEEVFDDELKSSPRFVIELTKTLKSLYADGARATLKSHLLEG